MTYNRQEVKHSTLHNPSQLASPLNGEDDVVVIEDAIHALASDKDIDCAFSSNLESMRNNSDAQDALGSQQQETNVSCQPECNDNDATLRSLNVEDGDIERGTYVPGSGMLDKRDSEGSVASSKISTLRDDHINVDVGSIEGEYFHPNVK